MQLLRSIESYLQNPKPLEESILAFRDSNVYNVGKSEEEVLEMIGAILESRL